MDFVHLILAASWSCRKSIIAMERPGLVAAAINRDCQKSILRAAAPSLTGPIYRSESTYSL